MAKKLQDLDYLIALISDEIEKGRIKLFKALDKQKTLSYWNIGRHINEHLTLHEDTADYGHFLFEKLSETFGIAKRTLYFSVQLNKTYSINQPLFNYLTWSHFRILLSIKPDEKRKMYEKILKTNKLTIRDFFLLVKNDSNSIITYDEDKIKFDKGIPFLYRIKYRFEEPDLDLGFHIYSRQYYNDIKDFEDKAIIQDEKNKNYYAFET